MGNKKRIQWNYQLVSEFINSLGYKLLSEIYLKYAQKLILRDAEGYLYFTSLENLKSNHIPYKFHKSNPYTIKNIKLWMKINNKNDFELLSDIYIDSRKYLQWQCLKDGCGEIFKTAWSNINAGDGCSYCSGHKIGLSNCLATKNPELAKEWHPFLNGDLTPWDVTVNSYKEVWWQCLDNSKHKWLINISSRNNKQTGCPYCSHCLPNEEYNLLVDNPTLCEEWDYVKNDKAPEDYTPRSDQYIWWKCKECSHEWEAKIHKRNKAKGTGCPECSSSKGEKECKRIFDLWNINYILQKEFEGLIGLGGGNLSYDFYLPKYNLLVEFQGIQHEKYIPGFHKSKEDFEKQVEHDKRKKEYAEQNKYNFLEIWYRDYDNIEEILNNYLYNKDVILLC